MCGGREAGRGTGVHINRNPGIVTAAVMRSIENEMLEAIRKQRERQRANASARVAAEEGPLSQLWRWLRGRETGYSTPAPPIPGD
jgi:hypothetical protein